MEKIEGDSREIAMPSAIRHLPSASNSLETGISL